jgi:hypothetical protein
MDADMFGLPGDLVPVGKDMSGFFRDEGRIALGSNQFAHQLRMGVEDSLFEKAEYLFRPLAPQLLGDVYKISW